MPGYETVLKELQSYFAEFGIDKDIQYAFGFFDAVSVLRNLQQKGVIR